MAALFLNLNQTTSVSQRFLFKLGIESQLWAPELGMKLNGPLLQFGNSLNTPVMGGWRIMSPALGGHCRNMR